jgi:microcystin degradation protein MlrC
MRIAVAGFQHETNSFSPVPADLASFRRATSWPGLTVGADLFPAVQGMNLAIAGFVAEARRAGIATAPLLWANATPSGPVTDEAFEHVMALMLEALAKTMPVDGVFLDLHGAMIGRSHPDGEAEILRRVRAVIGRSTPLIASLDLHANVSPEMVSEADALIPCRTYPHVDLEETGMRALAVARRLMAQHAPVHRAYWQPDFLIPIQAQTTQMEPARELYREAARIEASRDLLSLSLTLGFGPADTPRCGPAVAAFAANERDAQEAVAELAALLMAAEPRFGQPTLAPREAVARAMRSGRAGRPALLADLQDNPGAGGTGDTTGLLAALVAAKAEQAVLAVLHDPQAAAAAHAAGAGASLHVMLGGRRGGPGSVPLAADVVVERLGSGEFSGTGPMYRGARMSFGPMALLRTHAGPRVVVGSVNSQCADQSILRHLGIEPASQRMIALKSAVHFRADFEPIASEIILVEAPGANAADHRSYRYRHLRPGVRLMPNA